MTYKILKKVESSTNTYWQFVLDSNNAEYSTTDIIVLEAKLKELLQTIPIANLKVISELVFTDDLIFN